jgi:hypothetical protein
MRNNVDDHYRGIKVIYHIDYDEIIIKSINGILADDLQNGFYNRVKNEMNKRLK